jgi:hypothetical protein
MDRHRSGRTLTALGLIVPALRLGAAPAEADARAPHLLDVHAQGDAHQVGPVTLPPPTLPSVALLAVGLTFLAGLGWWRRVASRSRGRALAVALSLVLTVFTVETAVHSVHHLADHESGTDCPVLAGSQGLAWGTADLAGTDGPSLEVTTAPPIRSDAGPRWQLCRPSAGRAPPA